MNGIRTKRLFALTTTTCMPPLSACARRIRCFAKAAALRGWETTLYQVRFGAPQGPTSGEEDGVRFKVFTPMQYNALAGQVFPLKVMAFFVALISLTVELVRQRMLGSGGVVYLYSDDVAFTIWVYLCCRALGFVMVKDLVEWRPAFREDSRIMRWYYRTMQDFFFDGFIVISRFLEKRANDWNQKRKLHRPIAKVPIMVEHIPKETVEYNHEGHLFWCGLVDEYIDLVCLIIRAMGTLKKMYDVDVPLVIAGRVTIKSLERIRIVAMEMGLVNEIKCVGFVDEDELHLLMQKSVGLVVPLMDDVRSAARFPNKIAEFLATGIPVFISDVGDAGCYLQPRVNAFLIPPDDSEKFAGEFAWLLGHKNDAMRIGRAGREIAREHFAFEKQADVIDHFLTSVYKMTA